jgi:hypothetical protein
LHVVVEFLYPPNAHLRHQEQLTFEEIGKLLERSTSGARAVWLRAVERLNEALGKSP